MMIYTLTHVIVVSGLGGFRLRLLGAIRPAIENEYDYNSDQHDADDQTGDYEYQLPVEGY